MRCEAARALGSAAFKSTTRRWGRPPSRSKRTVWFRVFFFQAEDGIRDDLVTGVQTCALPISTTFTVRPSGGDHHEAWPVEVRRFLAVFLPLQRPPNYQLVADELASRFAFHRDRKIGRASCRERV